MIKTGSENEKILYCRFSPDGNQLITAISQLEQAMSNFDHDPLLAPVVVASAQERANGNGDSVARAARESYADFMQYFHDPNNGFSPGFENRSCSHVVYICRLHKM